MGGACCSKHGKRKYYGPGSLYTVGAYTSASLQYVGVPSYNNLVCAILRNTYSIRLQYMGTVTEQGPDLGHSSACTHVCVDNQSILASFLVSVT